MIAILGVKGDTPHIQINGSYLLPLVAYFPVLQILWLATIFQWNDKCHCREIRSTDTEIAMPRSECSPCTKTAIPGNSGTAYNTLHLKQWF